MTVEYWIGQEFDTSHERHAVKHFLDDMREKYGHSRDTYFVLANFAIYGRQIDLAVLKRDAVIVIDLKECSEPFRAVENGDWLTIPGRRRIAGGSEKRNPLEQVSEYRRQWMSYLREHEREFVEPAKVGTMNLTHVSAFVAISPKLHPDTENDIPTRLVWFRLTGADELAQQAYEQTSRELNFTDQELARLVSDVLNLRPGDPESGAVLEEPLPELVYRPGCAPPPPSLFVGRQKALRDLKSNLGLNGSKPSGLQVLTAVRGWPGVGKTTLAAALAHDAEIVQSFHDGVLWASLGEKPDLFSKLLEWGNALGADDITRSTSPEEISAKLAALLRRQRRLLIVDDVWKTEHAVPFWVGGKRCATLFTTRFDDVARALAPRPEDVYKLSVLSDRASLELLRILAPEVVKQHPDECGELIQDLEGLPLALQVAGRLLHTESSRGFDVTDLVAELREGAALLEAKAPPDRADLVSQTTPTVTVLLQKSTDILDPETRDCFAFLGAFAPKPATFDLEAMAAVWGILDPKPIARKLLDRGLLEFAGSRYQMHALLVMHARSLLE